MNDEITQQLQVYFKKFLLKKFKTAERILSPSDRVNEVYFLSLGHVREYVISEQGVELTVHIYQAGSAFPMLPIIHKQVNQHYFEALTDCELYIAPGDEFITYLKSHPDIMFDMMSRLLRGLDGLVKRIEYLTLNKASARLAAALLYLSRHFSVEEEGRLVFTQRFMHQEIASIVGLARETVSLEIEHMMAKGLISYTGRLLVLNSPKQLQDMLTA